jgi:hypothetical protein
MKFWNKIVDSERFCLYIKSYFFSKRRLFFWKPKNPSKKKTSANFRINEVNCGKIQDQFVISVLKTGITNWSQIWCLCLTILELLKTQHCAVVRRTTARWRRRLPEHNVPQAQDTKERYVYCQSDVDFFL